MEGQDVSNLTKNMSKFLAKCVTISHEYGVKHEQLLMISSSFITLSKRFKLLRAMVEDNVSGVAQTLQDAAPSLMDSDTLNALIEDQQAMITKVEQLNSEILDVTKEYENEDKSQKYAFDTTVDLFIKEITKENTLSKLDREEGVGREHVINYDLHHYILSKDDEMQKIERREDPQSQTVLRRYNNLFAGQKYILDDLPIYSIESIRDTSEDAKDKSFVALEDPIDYRTGAKEETEPVSDKTPYKTIISTIVSSIRIVRYLVSEVFYSVLCRNKKSFIDNFFKFASYSFHPVIYFDDAQSSFLSNENVFKLTLGEKDVTDGKKTTKKYDDVTLKYGDFMNDLRKEDGRLEHRLCIILSHKEDTYFNESDSKQILNHLISKLQDIYSKGDEQGGEEDKREKKHSLISGIQQIYKNRSDTESHILLEIGLKYMPMLFYQSSGDDSGGDDSGGSSSTQVASNSSSASSGGASNASKLSGYLYPSDSRLVSSINFTHSKICDVLQTGLDDSIVGKIEKKYALYTFQADYKDYSTNIAPEGNYFRKEKDDKACLIMLGESIDYLYPLFETPVQPPTIKLDLSSNEVKSFDDSNIDETEKQEDASNDKNVQNYLMAKLLQKFSTQPYYQHYNQVGEAPLEIVNIREQRKFRHFQGEDNGPDPRMMLNFIHQMFIHYCIYFRQVVVQIHNEFKRIQNDSYFQEHFINNLGENGALYNSTTHWKLLEKGTIEDNYRDSHIFIIWLLMVKNLKKVMFLLAETI